MLCAGTVGGVAMECLLLALAVRRMGYPIRPDLRNWNSPELASLRRQYWPLLISAIISSACVVVDQSVAGRLGPGKVSALAYGKKLVAGLITVAALGIGTAVLPAFSRLAAAKDWKQLGHSVLVYCGAVTLLMTPITAVLVVFSGPLVRAFFQHGAFQADATQLVTEVQRFALLQAPFAILLAIATRLTSALSANRLLVSMGAAALIADVILDIVFSRWLGVAGITLASAGVSAVSLCVLVALLHRHEPRLFSSGVR